ncbi:UNVERIFIED_ORG: uncharacterized protein DUF4435 [Pantoea allii]
MSRVTTLKDSRSNLSVKFLEFTRISSKKNYAAFFEGEDEKYYSIRINSIRPDLKWAGINCGGKKNVLALRDRVRNHEVYSTALCMFFVDADFDKNDDLLELSDLYTTPCYSVENFYISNNAFVRILSAEFGVNYFSDATQCLKKATALFSKLKFEYFEAIKGFNFLIKELRLRENEGTLEGRLNINNVNFESLIKVGIENVEKKYNESIPNLIFPELSENIQLDLNRSERYFYGLQGELWYRGKQNLEFFRSFVELLKVDRCKKNGREVFQNKGNVKLQLTKANCISELSQYADTPSCLQKFLRSQQAQSFAV